MHTRRGSQLLRMRKFMFADQKYKGLKMEHRSLVSAVNHFETSRFLKMADKKDASKAKEHEYLDFYGKQWDRCLIDTTFKTSNFIIFRIMGCI